MDFRLTAGELDTRLIIRRRTTEKDAIGDPEDDTNKVGDYWGSLQAVSNRNLELAKGFAGTVNYESKLHYCPKVTNDCQIVARGVTYFVNGVIHDPRQIWTLLFLTREQS